MARQPRQHGRPSKAAIARAQAEHERTARLAADEAAREAEWSDTQDDAHPIRWEPAGDPAAGRYVSEREALRRLANYYDDPAAALNVAGQARTQFAYYTDTRHPQTKRADAELAMTHGTAEPDTADLPAGATAEPWDDEADAELADAMHDVIHRHADQWSRALETAELDRWDAIERAHLTPDELATAAARFGIVADRDALPLNATGTRAAAALQAGRIPGAPEFDDPTHGRIQRQPGNDLGRFMRLAEAIERQRSTGDVWAGIVAARAGKTTHEARYYESSDGFEEREAAHRAIHDPRTASPILRAAR